MRSLMTRCHFAAPGLVQFFLPLLDAHHSLDVAGEGALLLFH